LVSLATFFARSLWRSGPFKAILALLVLSILAAFALSTADIGQPYKLFYDLLLFVQSFWLHALLLLWAYELAKNEQSFHLARLPLSTPLSRRAYEAGRFGALVLAALPLLVLLAVVNLLLAEGALAWQGALYGFSALLAGFLVLILSRFVAPASAVLYATALLVIGNGLDEFYLYAHFEESGASLVWLAKTLYVALPNFSLFDHQSALIGGAPWAWFSFVWLPIGYGVLLGWLIFEISCFCFRKKAL
jgi:hypothetical protein